MRPRTSASRTMSWRGPSVKEMRPSSRRSPRCKASTWWPTPPPRADCSSRIHPRSSGTTSRSNNWNCTGRTSFESCWPRKPLSWSNFSRNSTPLWRGSLRHNAGSASSSSCRNTNCRCRRATIPFRAASRATNLSRRS